MKKFLSIIVITIVILSAYVFVSRVKTSNAIKNEVLVDTTLMESRAEAFLFKTYNFSEKYLWKNAPPAVGKPACTFVAYGYDEKYVYGEGFCQSIFRSEDPGELGIEKSGMNAIRFSYVGSPRNPIIVWQKSADAICPKCGGTMPEDIFTEKYLKIMETKNEETYHFINHENLKKMLEGVSATDEVLLFVTQEYLMESIGSQHKKLNQFGWKDRTDIAKGEDASWDVALFLDYNWSNTNSKATAVGCFHVNTALDVTFNGEYFGKEGEVIKNINPKTCKYK